MSSGRLPSWLQRNAPGLNQSVGAPPLRNATDTRHPCTGHSPPCQGMKPSGMVEVGICTFCKLLSAGVINAADCETRGSLSTRMVSGAFASPEPGGDGAGFRGHTGLWHVCSLVGGQTQPRGAGVTGMLGTGHGYWNARHGYWNARHGYWSRCVCRLPQRRRWQGLCAIVRNANAAARRIWRAKAGAAGAGLASDVGHRVSSFGWGWCSPQKSVSSRGGNGIKCTLRRRHHLSV